MLSVQVLLAEPPNVPVKGELCHISGDTNQYVVVLVPDKVYPVNCFTNGTNQVIYRADGPTFIGISPTNDLTKELRSVTTNIYPTNFPKDYLSKWMAIAEASNRDHIKEMESDGSLTNVINALVSSGKLCAVRGHSWGEHGHFTLEYDPGRIGCRECKNCGLHQTQRATDWK